jgi:alpha/beta superfamily hydrolase
MVMKMNGPSPEAQTSEKATPAVLQSLFIPGPAGRLEALLNAGSADAPYSVLICHPHPPSGGTMHNKIVYQAMKAFNGLGLPVLRFNFRGTGLSQGTHDEGRGEVEDVHAALQWLDEKFRLPVIFAGFSFGANVGLRACCGDARVQGIVALGVPMHAAGRSYTYHFLPGCTQAKLFVSGTRDEFATVESVRSLVASTTRAELVLVPDADHFFVGKLDQVRSGISEWLLKHFLPAGPGELKEVPRV